MSKRGQPRTERGFTTAGGASFCHWCHKQLQLKPGGGFHFAILLTPFDGYPVRVHKSTGGDSCLDNALANGYKRAPDGTSDI